MWIPKYIDLVNFISFKEQRFDFRNNEAILIQGKNLQDKSQAGNGSGKSSLIEAVAVAFSGTSIRDVLTKDLIHIDEKSSEIEIYLTNPTINKTLKIWRKIYANTKSAECRVWINEIEKTDLPDINSYNKFIFETLGISKEDFFNFYLITDENGFVPFLKASDTKKKEIINRFSGADKVDLAIPFIEADAVRKQAEIDTVSAEIGKLQSNQLLLLEQSEKEEEKLNPEKLNESAEVHKDNILKHKIKISSHEDTIFVFNQKKREKELELAEFEPTDFDSDLESYEKEKSGLVERLGELKVSLVNCKDKFADEINAIKTKETTHAKEKADGLAEIKSEEEKIAQDKSAKLTLLKEKETKLVQEKKTTRDSINEYEVFIADIKKHLAGTIECPSCKHRFLLGDKEYNIDEAGENLTIAEGELAGLQIYLRDILLLQDEVHAEERRFIDNEAASELKVTEAKKVELNLYISEKEQEIESEKQSVNKKVLEEQEIVKKEINQNALVTTEVDKSILEINNTKEEEARKLRNINNDIQQLDLSIKREQSAIVNLNTDIASLQKQIELCLNVDRSKIEELEAQTLVLIEKEEVLAENLQKLTEEKKAIDTWMLNFKMFKSHLANLSLQNICSYTNMYLKEMGSNISIEIEGYRMMSNKKLKEEISTTVLKDGFPVGVYGKFSKGEKARIDICNVLANQALINLNSVTGGVNLLFCDEVLDSVDGEGLFNIVNACQSLGKCIMLVSQNEIHINGHTITIQKENKVSKILAA